MKLCSSVHGTIAVLLLCVPVDEAVEFAAVFGALIDGLPPDTSVIILAQTSARAQIQKWPCDTARRERLTIIDAGHEPMTSWACDLILAGVDCQGDPLLLATPKIDRRKDGRLPAILAEHAPMNVEFSSIMFEGGNILIGDAHVFIGADSPVITELDAGGREVIVVAAPACPTEFTRTAMHGDDPWQEVFHYHNSPGTRQPIFHIDMFMTLAGPDANGREQILVGDPALAAALLGAPIHPLALAEQFDAVASDLSARGFAVFRNPLPMIYMDNVEERRRTWYYASGNNVLVQRCETAGNIVWMAEYGHDNWPQLAKTDAANHILWQSLGYEVRMISDGQKLAENLGGLHCLTNVLKRG